MRGMEHEQVAIRNIGPLSLRASFRPASVDAEKRTVELVWTTGARVLRSGWSESFYEELSLKSGHVRMDRLKSGRAPLLDSHSGYSLGSVLGVVESARIEKGEGIARVRFARAEDDPEADKIFRKVRDGILANVSVGYRVHRFEKVEGGDEKLPVYRAVDWEPYELSLVGLPADAGTGTRAADVEALPCEFVSPSKESRKMDVDPKPESVSTPPAATAPAPAPAPASEDATRAAVEAATKAERSRAEGIRNCVRTVKLEESFAEKLIADGVSLDAARSAVFDRLATEAEKLPTTQHNRIEMGEDDHAKFRRNAMAAIFVRSGVVDTLRAAQEKTKDNSALAAQFAGLDFEPQGLRGMTLVDIARECLERRGIRTRSLTREQIVAQALTTRISGGQTISDFAVLLETVMHKTLLGGYAVAPDSWKRICGTKTVPDLRTHNFYRTGSFGELDDVNEHGEYENKEIPDGEKVSAAVTKKGNIIAITDEAIINDDLGVFNDLGVGLGRAAALSIEKAFYALLALNSGLGPTMSDSSPFFDDTARKNVGSGAALSAASIDADSTKMAYQLDPSSNEVLDLRPSVLLVPKGLERQAIGINNDVYDPDTANKLQKSNPARGMFSDIVATARLTAGSTRRYMFADPSTYPAFVVFFLAGHETPELQSKDGWRVDGVEWKVRQFFKVKEFDSRAAVTNAGTGG